MQWPGYHAWKRQFQTRDYTVNRGGISIGRLAGLVCLITEAFFRVKLHFSRPSPFADAAFLIF